MEQMTITAKVQIAATDADKVLLDETMSVYRDACNYVSGYEEISLACNATFGGPTTAAAFAINKGWHELVVPSILVGLLGYIIGNYFGVLIGNLLM